MRKIHNFLTDRELGELEFKPKQTGSHRYMLNSAHPFLSEETDDQRNYRNMSLSVMIGY